MAGGEMSPALLKPVNHQECMSCKKPITDKYFLKTMDQYWHEDCLKCSCCDCRLGEVGSTLFSKANLLLCRRDYLRLFGTTGYCAACKKMIPAFEMVMRAKTNVYHLECFACQQCMHRFCVGDRFYLADNKILCEFDYEERMMFSNTNGSANQPTNDFSNGLSNGYPPSSMGSGFSGAGGGFSGGGGMMGNAIDNNGGMPGLVSGGGGIPRMGGGVNTGMAGVNVGMSGSYGYGSGYNALTQMKKQTQSLSDDVSSGYGSPSPSSL